MKAIARITALENASSSNKTHRISNADCAVATNWKGCSAQTCRNGCWYTEAEYNKVMANNNHFVDTWIN